MARMFRPQFTISREDSSMISLIPSYEKTPRIRKAPTHKVFEYNSSNIFVFPTYRELKKEMKSIMLYHDINEITLYRSRRGEWGEWFEVWELYNNKLVIKKEGWM